MTPDIKSLLRKKNRLMKQGRTDEASAVAVKIGRAIARFGSRELRRLDKSVGTKKLWECVTNLTKPMEKPDHLEHIGVQDLNNHYASISTDPAHQEVTKKITANPQLHYFNEQQIFLKFSTNCGQLQRGLITYRSGS